ncbi:MAG TPA: LytTR family DNA-binding domain-containing protein [Gemmatimonadales bacterium]|nr:LytTR family DNA-binding domain-containing protein [Gemmatimonadales bacterium]
MRVVIVDDEPLARDKLKVFLQRHPRVELVGEAGDGIEAVATINQLKPDLVLLDIQMPELDGLEVVSGLDQDPLPHIIFVTAFDQYAVKAFDLGAVDYLLKPVAPDRFDLAMARAVESHEAAKPEELAERLGRVLEAMAPSRPRLERFLVRERERSRFVPLSAVDWIETAGNYLKLHTRQESHLIRATMTEVEARLDPAAFARIHRTTIVNLARVKYLEPWSHGDQRVVLDTGERLTLSRRYRDRLPLTLEG